MEIFYKTLEIINYVVIVIASISFLFQIVMIIFAFFLKEKHFKPSEDYHKIAVIFCARNEKDVIEYAVSDIFDRQDYPKDKYDVYVVADNCTDNTAELAKKAGAIVLIHNDPEPSHHKASYAIQYGLQEILKLDKKYDFFVKLDADNHICPVYLREMNNAYCAGARIARPYEYSTNPLQNKWASVSATYYIRDSMIANNFRENLHLDAMLTGAGMMCSMEIAERINGWDAMSASDDSEFTCKRLIEGERIHYVADAIVYEDQPSSCGATFARNSRMANGLHKVFWKDGWRMLFHFFKSGRWSNVDLFVQLLFVPFTMLCFLWFVPYYIFYILAHLINWAGVPWLSDLGVHGLNGVLFTQQASGKILLDLIIMIVIVVGTFVIIYPLQTWLALAKSKKKLGIKSMKPFAFSIFISPWFMVFYGICVFIGILSKPKWKAVKRNVIPKQD